MKNEITINLRVFPVLAHDHRTGVEEAITVPVTKEQLQAAQIVGQSSKELIERLCDRQGYTVLEIGKPVKRAVTLNLFALFMQDGENQAEKAKWEHLYGPNGRGGGSVSYYYNAAGQRFPLPERPLEPPDCWEPEPEEDTPEPEEDTPELTFDPEAHIYRLDGAQLPSVTQLTEIYSTYSEAPDLELTLETAAERGSVLHDYIEHRLKGGTREDYELPDAYAAYAASVDLFLAEHELDPMLVESPLWGEAEGVRYAGTPDYVGLLDGVLCILDWKSVSQIQKTKVGAQLNGYWSLCLDNDIFPEALYCVQFLPDGTYRIYPTGTLADSFYLCLSVYKERNKKHPRGGIA